MKNWMKVVLLVLGVTFAVWLPFLLKIVLPGWELDFRGGILSVAKNFDGPNYIIVAKTWYEESLIRKMFSNPVPLEYYPAHLPLYPALIRVLNFGFSGPWAMLIATVIGSVLSSLVFLKYLTEFKLSKRALLLVAISLILPARALIIRSVGSPEPWFILFILSSLYFFKKNNFLLAGLFGALAQLTKSPGILLFAAYGLFFIYEAFQKKRIVVKRWLSALPLAIIPLAAIALFLFYKIQTGDFFAYFHSGDNFHLFWPPFSIFSPKGQYWTGDFWLEEVIWLWLIYGIGVLRLWKEKLTVEAIFAGVFFTTTLFVAHRDVSRYILPIAPLVIIGWKEIIAKKEFKWIAILLIIPIFLFSWSFILHNQAPLADWTPYL